MRKPAQITSLSDCSTPDAMQGDPEKAQPTPTASSLLDNSLDHTPTSRSSATSVAAVESGPETPEHTYPDGGTRAWLTVLGSAAFLFCTGQWTAFGIFETWYSEHQLRNISAATISWIGSIQLWVLYFSVCVLPYMIQLLSNQFRRALSSDVSSMHMVPTYCCYQDQCCSC